MKTFGETMNLENEENEEVAEPTEIDLIVQQYNIKLPKHWETYTHEQKLEYIGHRMLLDMRTSTSHTVIKEEGWLSNYQLERRRKREVLSKFGSWDEIPPKRGVFSRTYINENAINITPPTPTPKEE